MDNHVISIGLDPSKDIISFTLDRDIANYLKLGHNENMNWKIIGRELVIMKKKEEE